MRQIGDKIKLPDGRSGTVVGVSVPIAAWTGADGRLAMERKNRELEVDVRNKDGSRSRVFVREEDQRGILLPSLVAALIGLGLSVLLLWLFFK